MPSQLLQESSDLLYRLQVIAMGSQEAPAVRDERNPMEQALANMSMAVPEGVEIG